MRKLDTGRPFARISPPHRGAHFEQDKLWFDNHGLCLSDMPTAAAAAETAHEDGASQHTTQTVTPGSSESGGETTTAHGTPEPATAPAETTQPDLPWNRLRKALAAYTSDGKAPKRKADVYGLVETLTGIACDDTETAIEALQVEGVEVPA